jgi:hypothetical protein
MKQRGFGEFGTGNDVDQDERRDVSDCFRAGDRYRRFRACRPIEGNENRPKHRRTSSAGPSEAEPGDGNVVAKEDVADMKESRSSTLIIRRNSGMPPA